MADDRDDAQRTEEPTQRRLDEARKKGDVIKSTELTSFVMLAGGTLAILLGISSGAETFLAKFLVYLERPDQIALGPGEAAGIFQQASQGLLWVLGPIVGGIMIAALSGHLFQNAPVFTAEKIKPDLSKLSLIKGMKRIFGWDGIVNLLKGVAKIATVGCAAFIAVWPERGRLAVAITLEPDGIAALALALAAKVVLASLVVLAIIAAADYAYQRNRFYHRNRMTRQEIKDEVKQSDGDPQVKARIRQLRYERAHKRMMAAVPTASVVITNPTHYAVALKYESGKMAAPVCIAKGMDQMAQRIREVAEEHDVPIVENAPLARALYAGVELEREIPAEHFKAVAEIIGYVMRLAKDRAFWRN